MRPGFIIAVALSIASICSASMLFLDGSSKSPNKTLGSLPTVDMKWGEGSEAGVPATAVNQKTSASTLGDDESYVFAGKCPNGEPYRFVSYQKNMSGAVHTYYDYSGPAGNGTVESDTAPKVMAVRICRPSAEIISTSYWESR
jgi:hypothetical protein